MSRQNKCARPEALAHSLAHVLHILRSSLLPYAAKFSAADVFDHKAAMAVLRARCLAELAGSGAEVLLVPTALTHWTIDELQVRCVCSCAEPSSVLQFMLSCRACILAVRTLC